MDVGHARWLLVFLSQGKEAAIDHRGFAKSSNNWRKEICPCQFRTFLMVDAVQPLRSANPIARQAFPAPADDEE